jgi:hypothetical protein
MPAVNVRRWGWADPNPVRECQLLNTPGSVRPLIDSITGEALGTA